MRQEYPDEPGSAVKQAVRKGVVLAAQNLDLPSRELECNRDYSVTCPQGTFVSCTYTDACVCKWMARSDETMMGLCIQGGRILATARLAW